MTTQEAFISEALALIEEFGLEGVTTRAVCSRVGVTAPTLYHHFGDIAGLVNAAVSTGFLRFLDHKQRAAPKSDLGEDLLSGWDNYLEFARVHPKLYMAMAAKYAAGLPIKAAQESRTLLDRKLEGLAALGRLTVAPQAAAEITWSSAHAAATLVVSLHPNEPTAEAIAGLRGCVERVLRPARRRKG